ncbi:hypothetical protein [Nostoc sp. GT001]|uniref:hypothetical protein n=1 Tax=unclassified Nostoc TaxID=2593658 RepID=UPI0025AA40B2|nr:hypothetical protein [Nostoc sp. GT001]MDM9580142.1 hypothetical protein [Nostoc sp. GT001]
MAQLLKEVFTWVLSNCDFKQTYFLLPKEAIAVYNVGTPCLYAASIYLQFLW